MLGSVSEPFDGYAGSYEEAIEHAIGFAGIEHDLFLAAKARALLELATELGDLPSLKFLDVGCGNGRLDLHLQPHVGEVHGTDVSEGMIAEARSANPAGVYTHFRGERLSYNDNGFDVAFAVCVFHHVEPVGRPTLVAEMGRVVRPGGMVAIAEHNPWNPLTRLTVARCEFDEDAQLLRAGAARQLLESSGLTHVRHRYLLFAPTLAPRWLGIERRLGRLPFGAQYVAAAFRPK